MINSKYNPTFALDKRPQYRVGLVTDFNTTTHTADVKLEGSECLTSVPVLGMFGAPHGNDVTWLQNLRGATVLLTLINSSYHILSTVPKQVKETKGGAYPTGGVPGAAASEAETLRKATAFRNFNANRPTDLLSGDKLIRAEGGAEVGLLQGGVARLKASPMAQFVLGKLKDYGLLIVRRFTMYSDFGEIKCFNDEGKVGLSIKGGGDYMTESHPSAGKNTIEISVGSCASDAAHRLFIETKDSSGKAKNKLSLSMDGKVSVWAKGETTVEVLDDGDAPMSKMTLGGDGKVTLWVKGDIGIESAEGSFALVTKADVTLTAEGAVSIDAKADVTITSAAMVNVEGTTINLN